MSKKIETCEKCGNECHCDSHHILPQKLFGDGETTPLCKTCHDDYHRFLGFKFLRKEHKQTEEFYLHNWYKWIYAIIFVGLLFAIGTLISFVI